jgi:hypothetical protein
MPPTTDYYAREAALAAYSPLHFVTPPEMASAVWEILARLGPEDALYAVQQKSSSDGLATSGPDWKIERSKIEPSRLYYKDQAEAARLAAIVESDRCGRATLEAGHGGNSSPPTYHSRSQESAILRDLQKSRYLCAQPAFALALCVKGHREHQRKACTPSYVEHLKCSVKLCVEHAAAFFFVTRAAAHPCHPPLFSTEHEPWTFIAALNL